ncbi:hypothetical protein D3C87_1550670 [compost metagenome]
MGVVGELLEGLVVLLKPVEGGRVRLEARFDGHLKVQARLGEPLLPPWGELGRELIGEAIDVLVAVAEVIAGRLHARVPTNEVLVAQPVIVGAAEGGHRLGRSGDGHRGLCDRRRQREGVSCQASLGGRRVGGGGSRFRRPEPGDEVGLR